MGLHQIKARIGSKIKKMGKLPKKKKIQPLYRQMSLKGMEIQSGRFLPRDTTLLFPQSVFPPVQRPA